ASPVTLSRASNRGTGCPILALGSGAASVAMSQLHGRGLEQRAHQRTLAETYLEQVVLLRVGIRKRHIRSGFGRLLVHPLSFQGALGGFGAPRHRRHPSQSDPRFPYDAVLPEIEGDCRRREREFVGL